MKGLYVCVLVVFVFLPPPVAGEGEEVEQENAKQWLMGNWQDNGFNVSNLQENAWRVIPYNQYRSQVVFTLLDRMQLNRLPEGGMTTVIFPWWPSDGNAIIHDLNNAGFRAHWHPDTSDFIGIVIKWGDYKWK